MLQLSTDLQFHFEILRALSATRYDGADVAEVLQAAENIKAGDFGSWHDTWFALAQHVKSQAEKTSNRVSKREAYFRASTYFRFADFFLHGNWEDPRINSLWDLQLECFDKASALLDLPPRRQMLKADGFEVPIIFWPCANGATPRPTMVIGNGYDGAQEELYHHYVLHARERGYHVVTYEGPGQCSVRRNQNIGFIIEWEKAVTPIFDWLENNQKELGVDMEKVGLIGNSMGGWLAQRAAAFEHRIAALATVDGLWDIGGAYTAQMPPEARAALQSTDLSVKEQFDAGIKQQFNVPDLPTRQKWGLEQGLWTFNTRSPYEFLQRARGMTMEGISNGIKCPVWVGCPQHDIFFKGQPELVKEKLGDRATLVHLTDEDAAGAHCHVGALSHLNMVLFDWFEEKMGAAKSL